MTWDEFVLKVEASLTEQGFDRNTPLGSIQWDAAAFGGPTPGVYVTRLDLGDGPKLEIVED